MGDGVAHRPMLGLALLSEELNLGRQLTVGEVASPVGGGRQDLGVLPRGLGEIGVVLGPFLTLRVYPHLRLAQPTHAHLGQPRHGDRDARLFLGRLVDEPAHGFHPAGDVVVAPRIGVVGLVIVGQCDGFEPLDGLEAVGVGYQHTDGAAALAREPFAVQLVAKNDGVVARRIFEGPPDGKRAAEHLFWILVVVAVIVHPPNIGGWLCQPDDGPQRHTFPQTHPEGVLHVVARHRLEEAHGMFVGQLHEPLEVEGVALFPGHRVDHRGIAFGVGDDIQLPGLTLQPDLEAFFQWQGVGQGFSPLHRAELVLVGQVLHVGSGLLQYLGIRFLGPCGNRLRRPQSRRSQAHEVTARHLQVLPAEIVR